MVEEDRSDLTEWWAAVRATLSKLPPDYKSAAPAAAAVRAAFHDELAKAVEPRMNARLKGVDQGSLSAKKSVAAWVNHELHYVLGLTIRCPRTGSPAILVTDVRDAENQASRFRLEVQKADGRKTRTYSSARLPELQLMGDPPRRESFSRWRDGGGGGSSGPSR